MHSDISNNNNVKLKDYFDFFQQKTICLCLFEPGPVLEQNKLHCGQLSQVLSTRSACFFSTDRLKFNYTVSV